MRYQDEASGLFRTHDGGTTAHVRDNIYCAATLWALSRAYKRVDNDNGRSRELALCCVKCMRRILLLWMEEAHRVENFKNEQTPENAVHCKFYVDALKPVHDRDYHHLQIDVVGLFVIFLTQMIASGLDVVFTSDEVSMVQNLVFYLERAYRTPDFGIWERGSKYNNGQAELHASSIGAAKVALECINAFNLYGERGASWSVAYVDVDAHNRNRQTIESMLPRESSSKNTDAALLCTLSYPMFAMHAPEFVQTSLDKVRRKLEGRYGYKRFLRDGYGTAYDAFTVTHNNKQQQKLPRRQFYYETNQLHKFDGIESEWPIFFAYLIIDGVFRDDYAQVEHYQALLEPLLRESYEGDLILPKYYYVPENGVEAERRQPGSQHRLPSDDAFDDMTNDTDTPQKSTPGFLWGQAIFVISQLLVENLLHANDLDPLRLHLPSAQRYTMVNKRYSSFRGSAPQDLAVQVCLVAESVRLQQMLATYGIASQTPTQLAPAQIWSPTDLINLYTSLGRNDALGLTGRPKRPFGVLSTSKVYRIAGTTVVCYPLFFDISDFYLSFDVSVLMDDICSAFAFVAHRWSLHGRPTVILLIREDNFNGPYAGSMLNLLASLRIGTLSTNTAVRVKLGTLQTFLASSCVEQLDFLTDASVLLRRLVQPLKERTPSDTTDAKSFFAGAGRKIGGGGGGIFDMVQRGQTPTAQSGQALVVQRRRQSMRLSSSAAAAAVAAAARRVTDEEGDSTGVGVDTSDNNYDDTRRHQLASQLLSTTQLNQLCQQHENNIGQLLAKLHATSVKQNALDLHAALLLCALYRKEGPHFIVFSDPPANADTSNTTTTVQQQLERTIRYAASNGEWLLVRFCSAVMRKVVASLAPSITSMLVRQKILTVGVFGQKEIVIDKPITPANLSKAIYDACEPYDATSACLQQEVILNVGKLIEAYPQLFDGILKIRVGWIVQAMAMYKLFSTDSDNNNILNVTLDREQSTGSGDGSGSASAFSYTDFVQIIAHESPASIKDLIVKILCLPFEQQYEARVSTGQTIPTTLYPTTVDHDNSNREDDYYYRAYNLDVVQSRAGSVASETDVGTPTASASVTLLLMPLQRRQIDGCLGRVPERFYNRVWYILQRAPAGIRIAGCILPQQPTLTEMTLSELSFALRVDSLLDRCMYPAYRQLVVELLLVINVILQRNPECRFQTLLDTDELVVEALEKFMSSSNVTEGAAVRSRQTQEEQEQEAQQEKHFNRHYYSSFDAGGGSSSAAALLKSSQAAAAASPPPRLLISRQPSSRSIHSPPMKHYNEHAVKFTEDEWQLFYNQPPTVTANFFAFAVANKLLDELRSGATTAMTSRLLVGGEAGGGAGDAAALPECALN